MTSGAPDVTDDATAGCESSRRGFLAGVGAAAATSGALATGLATGLAGCVSIGTMGSGSKPIEILAAGSLQRSLGEGLRAAVDVPITVETHGSVTVARLIASGQRDPDVVVLADTALFDSVLDAPWYAAIATNALVVAHTETPDPHPIAAADRWFEPIRDGTASLGRTDPALDPLGYRTVFAFDLGEQYYDEPALRASMFDAAAIYPETSLVSRLEAGAVDAAVVYRNMAAERGYPTVALPSAIDLSDPDGEYGAATYELEDGTVVNIQDTLDELSGISEVSEMKPLVQDLGMVANQDLPYFPIQEKYEQSFINTGKFDVPESSDHLNVLFPLWWLPKVDEKLESASESASPGLMKAKPNN